LVIGTKGSSYLAVYSFSSAFWVIGTFRFGSIAVVTTCFLSDY